jgi:hypothetical protein
MTMPIVVAESWVAGTDVVRIARLRRDRRADVEPRRHMVRERGRLAGGEAEPNEGR